jgi:hypothetical protein
MLHHDGRHLGAHQDRPAEAFDRRHDGLGKHRRTANRVETAWVAAIACPIWRYAQPAHAERNRARRATSWVEYFGKDFK